MKIALDLDDTIVDTVTPILLFINEKYGLNLVKDKLKAESLGEEIGVSREQERKLIQEYVKSRHCKKTRPVEGAVEAVRQMAKSHNLSVVTYRSRIEEQATIRLVRKFFGRNSPEEPLKKKHQTCLENNFQLILEDNYNNAIECYQNGVRVILFDYPWNRKPIPSEITRVQNWQEALKVI